MNRRLRLLVGLTLIAWGLRDLLGPLVRPRARRQPRLQGDLADLLKLAYLEEWAAHVGSTKVH